MLKREEIIKSILEINKTIGQIWIKDIYSLDKYTILLKLYKKGLKAFLILSIKKNDYRLHLLFIPKIPKELSLNTPFQQLLNRYIKGKQIIRIDNYYPHISIKTKSNEIYNLIIDFNALNIILLNEKGKIISSINSKIDKKENYLYPIEGNKDLNINNSFTNKCENLSQNKALSDEFIQKKTEDIKRKINKTLKKELKKNLKLLNKLNQEKSEVDNKDIYKTYGEILKYNLNAITRGMKKAKLRDFYGNEIEIPLNPKLSPKENMEIFFKKYKKFINKDEPLTKRIDKIKNNVENITSLMEKIKILKTPLFPKKPEEIIKEIGFTNDNISKLIYSTLIEKKNVKKSMNHSIKEPFLRLYTSSGKQLLVGRNARENDNLAIKFSRGNDLWFHSEEVEGSHVVLRYNNRNDNFSEKDIEEASLIAAYYSKLRKYGKGNVVYTRCKYLTKPKDSKPGFVIYHKNKTIYIKIDEDRVKKLLENSFNYREN